MNFIIKVLILFIIKFMQLKVINNKPSGVVIQILKVYASTHWIAFFFCFSLFLEETREFKLLLDEDRRRIAAKAQAEAKSIDLAVVRLMFIAYLPDSSGAFTIMLKPVISYPIYDSSEYILFCEDFYSKLQ